MNKLKEFRLKAGLTQEELGKRINQSLGSISHYENSIRTPDIDIAKAIIDVFSSEGVSTSIEEVFFPEEPTPDLAA